MSIDKNILDNYREQLAEMVKYERGRVGRNQLAAGQTEDNQQGVIAGLELAENMLKTIEETHREEPNSEEGHA